MLETLRVHEMQFFSELEKKYFNKAKERGVSSDELPL